MKKIKDYLILGYNKNTFEVEYEILNDDMYYFSSNFKNNKNGLIGEIYINFYAVVDIKSKCVIASSYTSKQDLLNKLEIVKNKFNDFINTKQYKRILEISKECIKQFESNK